MVAFRRILCPVDLSEFSHRAVRHAVALARWYGAEVTALSVRPTVLQPTPWMEYPTSFPLESPEDRERAAQSVLTFVREIAEPTPVQVLVTDGSVVPEILKTAEDISADLIVMGTHGLSGFERFMLGSVTEKVLRKAQCPVLTVPHRVAESTDSPHVTFKTILCAVDFSPSSDRALEYALSLAQEAGGRLVLVHALEWFAEQEPRLSAHFNVSEYRRALEVDARERLAASIPESARTWCEAEPVIAHGKAYREILRIAGDRKAELIILGVQGRNAVDLTLFGSTAQHVVRQAACPVLTVPLVKVAKAQEVKAAREVEALS
jgi:nucleotide-binding universal stress UspA family protein